MLTRRQADLLAFLDRSIREMGICPTYEDMRVGLGLKSKEGPSRLIRALEERGFIRRLPGRARANVIVRLPGEDGEIARLRAALAATVMERDQLRAELATLRERAA